MVLSFRWQHQDVNSLCCEDERSIWQAICWLWVERLSTHLSMNETSNGLLSHLWCLIALVERIVEECDELVFFFNLKSLALRFIDCTHLERATSTATAGGMPEAFKYILVFSFNRFIIETNEAARDVMAKKTQQNQINVMMVQEEAKPEETPRSLVVISSLRLDVIGNRRE